MERNTGTKQQVISPSIERIPSYREEYIIWRISHMERNTGTKQQVISLYRENTLDSIGRNTIRMNYYRTEYLSIEEIP
jgi:hypothetical protein